MPIYQYACQSCGAEIEAMVTVKRGKEIEIEPCPECGERAMRRVIATPAVHMRYSNAHPRHMRGQRKR